MRDAAAAHHGTETVRGRGPVYVVPAPVGDGRWVVRPYRRGGAVASWLGDRYLRVGTPRPVREFAVGRAVEDLGIPTPPHIGAAVYPSGPWYRGDLVTEWVPHSRDLAAVLFAEGARTEATDGPPRAERLPGSSTRAEMETALAAAGSLIRVLHDRGVVHRDLNLKNILISAAPADMSPDRARTDAAQPTVRALVLDLDRASLGSPVGDRGRRRMLDRFWRSARKWETSTGRSLDPALRAAFEAGYGR